MKAISYTRKAIKALKKMPAEQRDRIQAKIKIYAKEPESLANNVTSLSGRSGIRLRVGDYRIIMDDSGAVLDVLDVGPRGSIYE